MLTIYLAYLHFIQAKKRLPSTSEHALIGRCVKDMYTQKLRRSPTQDPRQALIDLRSSKKLSEIFDVCETDCVLSEPSSFVSWPCAAELIKNTRAGLICEDIGAVVYINNEYVLLREQTIERTR